MNWIERTIATVSPQWAYKRMAWRSASNALYDAGTMKRTTSNWNPSLSYDENKMKAERELLRSRARDLERNSDIAESVIDAFIRNVIGSGITLQAKTEDDDTNNAIETLWKDFCKADNCDITATQSFEEMCELMLRRRIVDGGILIVKVYTEDKKFPFKLQIREVDELAQNVINSGENRIIDGIEINDYNKPLRYYFKKYKNNILLPDEHDIIDADRVIFWKGKTSTKQVREVSMLAAALERIKDANQFLEAVSIKERVLACLAVFIKKTTPSNGIGRSHNGSQQPISYDGVSLSPGMIGELNPGDEVQTVVPAGQASNTKEFIMTLIRLIGAGVGLSYESISRDMSNVNYSSARQALIEDRKTFKRMQLSFTRNVLIPIFNEFIDAAILSNQLVSALPSSDSIKYKKHTWIPPGQQWIDPLKEVNANKNAIESNQDTLQRICAERGEDWREVVKQRSLETKLIDELIGGVQTSEKN